MNHFAELNSPQVAALLEDGRIAVLLLPIGAVEPHGPHAPLATDTIISLGMCRRAATALENDPAVRALILPPLPYGVTRYASAFPGTVGVREETLHGVVVDTCAAAIAQGLRRIVLVNNHFEPEHVATLRRAAETLRTEHGGIVGLLDLVRRRNAERLTEEFRSGSCHAGRYETSLVLADDPDLVDTQRMRELPDVPVGMPKEIAAGREDFVAMGMEHAYCGDPAAATAAEGETTFATLTAMLVEVIRETAREE